MNSYFIFGVDAGIIFWVGVSLTDDLDSGGHLNSGPVFGGVNLTDTIDMIVSGGGP